jgi:hypothetical protein
MALVLIFIGLSVIGIGLCLAMAPPLGSRGQYEEENHWDD